MREGADRLIAAADLGAPTGEVDVAAAKLPTDIERGQPDRLQRNRIETHPDLALNGADALDAADTTDPLQLTADHVFNEE